jgi:hypothetical protein
VTVGAGTIMGLVRQSLTPAERIGVWGAGTRHQHLDSSVGLGRVL